MQEGKRNSSFSAIPRLLHRHTLIIIHLTKGLCYKPIPIPAFIPVPSLSGPYKFTSSCDVFRSDCLNACPNETASTYCIPLKTLEGPSIFNVGACVCDLYVQPKLLRFVNGDLYSSLSNQSLIPQHPLAYQSKSTYD